MPILSIAGLMFSGAEITLAFVIVPFMAFQSAKRKQPLLCVAWNLTGLLCLGGAIFVATVAIDLANVS